MINLVRQFVLGSNTSSLCCIAQQAMLSALNRGPELAIHTRGAIRNGCTEVEIREVLLQVSTCQFSPVTCQQSLADAVYDIRLWRSRWYRGFQDS